MTDMTLHFLSRGDIAELLGVSVTSIKKGYGQLPPPDVTVGQKAVQGWSRETIDKWIAERQARAQAKAQNKQD